MKMCAAFFHLKNDVSILVDGGKLNLEYIQYWTKTFFVWEIEDAIEIMIYLKIEWEKYA